MKIPPARGCVKGDLTRPPRGELTGFGMASVVIFGGCTGYRAWRSVQVRQDRPRFAMASSATGLIDSTWRSAMKFERGERPRRALGELDVVHLPQPDEIVT